MNCQQTESKLIELLFDELPDDEASALRKHLADCRQCASEWNELEESRRALALDQEPQVAPALSADEILNTLRLRESGRSRRWTRIAGVLAALAGVVLCAALFNLRIEFSQQRCTIAWGDSDPSSPSEPDPDPPVPRDVASSARLDNLEELLALTAREVLDVEQRQAASLHRYDSRFDQLDRLKQRLEDLQTQNDRRWRLLARELLRRDQEFASTAQ